MTVQKPHDACVVPFPNLRKEQAAMLAYLRALLIDLDREIETGCYDRDFAVHLAARAFETGRELAATLGIPDEELQRLVRVKAWLQCGASP